MVRVCRWWSCRNRLQVCEMLMRGTLCNRLTAQHNSRNAAHLGGATVSSSQCQAALSSPNFYGTTEYIEQLVWQTLVVLGGALILVVQLPRRSPIMLSGTRQLHHKDHMGLLNRV